MVLKFCKRGQVPQHTRCEKAVIRSIKPRNKPNTLKNRRSAAIAICNVSLKCQVKR